MTTKQLMIGGVIAYAAYTLWKKSQLPPMSATSIGPGGSSIDLTHLPPSIQAAAVKAMQDAATAGIQF